ncbi:MAG: radical SAM protein, partial [Paraclostridium sp.]
MFNETKCIESSEKNVWKYIFTKDDAIAEAVLYKYEEFEKRTVICCSTMSGCPVGCKFCGTGKKFIKNLSSFEIIQQVEHILVSKGIDTKSVEKFQIMFMSMGEPMLNWDAVEKAIEALHDMYPNADLLISTIGVNNDEVFNKI